MRMRSSPGRLMADHPLTSACLLLTQRCQHAMRASAKLTPQATQILASRRTLQKVRTPGMKPMLQSAAWSDAAIRHQIVLRNAHIVAAARSTRFSLARQQREQQIHHFASGLIGLATPAIISMMRDTLPIVTFSVRRAGRALTEYAHHGGPIAAQVPRVIGGHALYRTASATPRYAISRGPPMLALSESTTCRNPELVRRIGARPSRRPRG